jgi:hypothetical protein
MGKLLIAGANPNRDELRHEGIRVGEIIAYRAWRVMEPVWDDRLYSVFVRDYVWHPEFPASGDIREHGIYSFRRVIRSHEDYCHLFTNEPLVFGKVRIWGEIVEHEFGYRSEFAKIVSLDYGDPELLDRFRKIYRVNQESKKEVRSWPFDEGTH